ncbi:hypothetical protein GF354_06410 [Candidatus Peregrinibacteria bacterium]|nr:hypothetical protein [Candidatus Peregrinibacteria bacterium]
MINQENSLTYPLKEKYREEAKEINKRFKEVTDNPSEESIQNLNKDLTDLESMFVKSMDVSDKYNELDDKREELYQRNFKISPELTEGEEVTNNIRKTVKLLNDARKSDDINKIVPILVEVEEILETTEDMLEKVEAKQKELEAAQEAVTTPEESQEAEPEPEPEEPNPEPPAEPTGEQAAEKFRTEYKREIHGTSFRESSKVVEAVKEADSGKLLEDLETPGKIKTMEDAKELIDLCKNSDGCELDEGTEKVNLKYSDKKYEIRESNGYIWKISKFNTSGNLQTEIYYDRTLSNPETLKKIKSTKVTNVLESGEKVIENYDRIGNITDFKVKIDDETIEKLECPKAYNLKIKPIKNDEGKIIGIKGYKNNKKVFLIEKTEKGTYKKVMFTSDGKEFGTYRDEKSKNPDLTMDQYIKEYVEGELKDGDRISIYLSLFFEYGGADSKSQKLSQFLNNKKESIVVDCEEYAELARRARTVRGGKAFILVLDGKKNVKDKHAVCVEVTERNGYYYAQKWDNLGYKRSGKNSSASEAIQDVLSKYNGNIKDESGKKIYYDIAFEDNQKVEIFEDGKNKKRRISDMYVPKEDKEGMYAKKK